MSEKIEFKVAEVELEKSNLIEASAGTGKTYSIAILVVRMVIEKKLNLNEILMVTFTNAAVAELQVRIRKFIREAYSYALHGTKIEDTIKTIVENDKAKTGRQEIIRLLNNARKQLDETSIFTIHGFCQKTLTEFAFETEQAFGSDVIVDQSAIINSIANDYWRESITTIPTNELSMLTDGGLSKNQLITVITKSLSGKEFIYDDKLIIKESLESLALQHEQYISAKNNFHKNYYDNLEKYLQISNTAAKYIKDHIRDVAKLRKELQKKQGKALFSELSDLASILDNKELLFTEKANEIIYFLYGKAIEPTKEKIKTIKQEQFIFSYDDLIDKLHQAVISEYSTKSENLKKALQKKYKAVFIDEFQDTDQKQYEIFNTIFHKQSILFYIGDPKQSIYSFNGTDIDTYLDASTSGYERFTMSTNYRSSTNYVKVMNNLFNGVDNPFIDNRIKYESVEANKKNEELTLDTIVVEALSVYQCDTISKINTQTAYQVNELLTGNYKIGGRRVVPSDIGILVKANSKGADIKRELNKINIPAITIDETKVFKSDETIIVIDIIKAMLDTNRSSVSKAILNKFTNRTKDDLISSMLDTDIANFKEFNKKLHSDGVFSAMNNFISRYSVKDNIENNYSENSDRVLSNLLQITEELHTKETRSKIAPKELIHWISSIAKDDNNQNDDGKYAQRLESDEDAVKIVTIHKSKGLEYNIVIAPYLDLSSEHNSKWDTIEYKDPDKNCYCFSFDKTTREHELYSKQTKRENLRLVYVALTRAVYKGIIIHDNRTKLTNSSIKTLIDPAIKNGHIAFSENIDEVTKKYKEKKIINKSTIKEVTLHRNLYQNKRVYNFSSLSKYEPHSTSKANGEIKGYDKFIFNDFPKGIIAGNFMHHLFENISFNNNNFDKEIGKAKNRYSSVFKYDEDKEDELISNISNMLTHVLKATIPTDNPFTLSEIDDKKKLVEMPFNYQITNFDTKELREILNKIGSVTLDDKIKGEIQGFMNGSIDLLFKHNGKFYVLDWKSSYLGNAIEDYEADKLEIAVQKSNYHLQYYIYTVATKLYLQSINSEFNFQQQFGGVIYVYARGCRTSKSTGIYYTMPDKKIVEEVEKLMITK